MEDDDGLIRDWENLRLGSGHDMPNWAPSLAEPSHTHRTRGKWKGKGNLELQISTPGLSIFSDSQKGYGYDSSYDINDHNTDTYDSDQCYTVHGKGKSKGKGNLEPQLSTPGLSLFSDSRKRYDYNSSYDINDHNTDTYDSDQCYTVHGKGKSKGKGNLEPQLSTPGLSIFSDSQKGYDYDSSYDINDRNTGTYDTDQIDTVRELDADEYGEPSGFEATSTSEYRISLYNAPQTRNKHLNFSTDNTPKNTLPNEQELDPSKKLQLFFF
jgi:hypothetical protein